MGDEDASEVVEKEREEEEEEELVNEDKIEDEELDIEDNELDVDIILDMLVAILTVDIVPVILNEIKS